MFLQNLKNAACSTIKWSIKGVAYPLHYKLQGRQIAELSDQLQRKYGNKVATCASAVLKIARLIFFVLGCIACPITLPAYFAERKFYSPQVFHYQATSTWNPYTTTMIDPDGTIRPYFPPANQPSSPSASASSQQ